MSVGKVVYKSATASLLTIKHWSASTQPFHFQPCLSCDLTSSLSEDNHCQLTLPRRKTAILPDSHLVWNRLNNLLFASISDLCDADPQNPHLALLPTIPIDTLDAGL